MVYRSVKVILQNSTNELLTVEGFEVIRGQWTTGLEPEWGHLIQSQSTETWGSESEELTIGTEAYVHCNSTCGYITIHWQLEWVGELVREIQVPASLHSEACIQDEDPAAVVMVITLTQ